MHGLMESIGEDDFLKWIIFHHERQEDHVRAAQVRDATCSGLRVDFLLARPSCSQMKELSVAAGECKVGLTVITDMHGMSLRHASPAIFGLMQKRTRLELDHYPETAKRYAKEYASTCFNNWRLAHLCAAMGVTLAALEAA